MQVKTDPRSQRTLNVSAIARTSISNVTKISVCQKGNLSASTKLVKAYVRLPQARQQNGGHPLHVPPCELHIGPIRLSSVRLSEVPLTHQHTAPWCSAAPRWMVLGANGEKGAAGEPHQQRKE